MCRRAWRGLTQRWAGAGAGGGHGAGRNSELEGEGAQATAWDVGNNSETREGAQPGVDMPCRVPCLGCDWGPGLSYLLTTAEW